MKPKPPQPLIIKKYENRRLYNTLTSQYINQEQVAQLLRDGYDVRVTDASSGEDITRIILAQIVLDDVKTPDSVFPLDILRQMILASGKATQEGALRYLKAMMEMYQNAYRVMPPALSSFNVLPGWPQSQDRKDASTNSKRQTGEHPPSRNRETDSQESEVTELRRRVEELESALAGRRRRKKAPDTKSRRNS
jgi:polyhydroxyalkanoate synthesis repressor PhaR